MIGIRGEYKFKIGERIILEGSNLITLLGESFFLNRWVNDEFEPIQSIVLGKGSSRPLKSDESLGNQTVSKNCNYDVDLREKKVVLDCSINASEIVDTSEIGVANNEILISHDLYEPITTEILGNDTTSTVNIEYSFCIVTGGIRSQWNQSRYGNNIYYIYEPATVVGVLENNTQSGYTRKNSIEELTQGSYYYDSNSKNLYIMNTSNTDPNNSEIIVQTK